MKTILQLVDAQLTGDKAEQNSFQSKPVTAIDVEKI